LSDENITCIVDGYRSRREEEGFSHRASLTEIAENDFNLNVPRYVSRFRSEETIDLPAVIADLKRLERDMAPLNDAIRRSCAELGLESPV
jgi:type I restriction enzyme M protein